MSTIGIAASTPAAVSGAAAAVAAPGAEDAGDAELDERRLAFTFKQIALVRWQVVATVLVIVVLVWQAVPAWLTLGWAAAALACREVRVAAMRRLADDAQRPVGERLERAMWWILVVGLSQGSAAVFMFWLDAAEGAILTMILVSLSAGAASTSALVRGSFRIQSGCLLLPAAAFWIFLATDGFRIPFELSLGVGALMLMFFQVQNRFADGNLRTFEESFRIRRENEALRLRAEEASRAKTRFLAAASHDLRQPLQAVSFHSAALALNPHAADSPAIVRSLSKSLEGLSALLDSLLNISKLDTGTETVELRSFKLHKLVESIGKDFRGLAEAKGLRFQLDCPNKAVVVHTDPQLLGRLLRNLVDNAVKYTAAGTVTLSLGEDGADALIRVGDTGCGIAADQQPRVFEEFYRVEGDGGAGESVSGLGLGLSIVDRVKKLLGLRLELESALGQGTCVSVRVPLPRGGAQPAAGAETPLADAAVRLDGLRVLVVDDEPAVREATATLLRRLGCQVEAAGNGDAAVAAASRLAPSVVVTDYRLGNGETGLALARRLRRDQPGLPVLLISGDTAPDRLREAADSGLPMLHKPLSAEQLKAAIAQAVAARGAAAP